MAGLKLASMHPCSNVTKRPAENKEQSERKSKWTDLDLLTVGFLYNASINQCANANSSMNYENRGLRMKAMRKS